ncbi:glycosyltransferase family 92 protein [Azospirillum halopraeferens]|uniref:glycosyltransferase family 92 protein n=1 Tax=Azospirillum halopraeferens TaxID=34010 RepID=UPI00041500B9|nr:glycosyltransferase family 92 protein [Azospirillum halopraeferens]
MLGLIDAVELGNVHGWLWNPHQPDVRQPVTVWVDGTPVARAVADRPRPDLQASGIGDGGHGFTVALPRSLLDNAFHRIVVTVGDGEEPIGGEVRAWLLDEEAERCPPVDVVERPKPHYLTVCAIARNEGPYLLEWIAYHRVVGVDHFVVFDNESTDAGPDMLARLAAEGIVTVVPWPGAAFSGGPQIPAYDHAIHRFRDLTEWLAFIDLDEFLVPNAADDVPTILRRYPDVTGLGASWRVFGTSGHATHEPGPVMDRFRRCAPADDPLHRHVKSIVRADYAAKPMVHAHFLRAGAVVDEDRRPVRLTGGGVRTGTSVAVLQVNHYVTKSLEEWAIKAARGRPDRGPGAADARRTDADLALHDRNECEDTAILRFRDATVAEMARLRAEVLDSVPSVDTDVRGTPIPLPPPELTALVGGSDNFTAVGDSLARLLIEHSGLRSDDSVLEIGCGVGRVARALSGHIRPPGRYEGMDIHRPHIDWCTQQITARHAHFRFHHADIRNAAYNPRGTANALDYRFPFADRSFRFIVLLSVFTHMLEPEILAYLREIRRMLAPDGRLLATFFLLNAGSERAIAANRCRIAFDYRAARFWSHSRELPEVAIAFREEVVHELFAAAGLTTLRVDYGDWADRPGALSYQDVMIAGPGA